jgi:hypothetical protein
MECHPCQCMPPALVGKVLQDLQGSMLCVVHNETK